MELCTGAARCPSLESNSLERPSSKSAIHTKNSSGSKLAISLFNTAEQFSGLCSSSEHRHASPCPPMENLSNPFELRQSTPRFTSTLEQPALDYPSLNRDTLISCIQDCPSLSEAYGLSHCCLMEFANHGLLYIWEHGFCFATLLADGARGARTRPNHLRLLASRMHGTRFFGSRISSMEGG